MRPLLILLMPLIVFTYAPCTAQVAGNRGGELNFQRLASLLGWERNATSGSVSEHWSRDWWHVLHACAYDLVLSPSKRLAALEESFYSASSVAMGADGRPLMNVLLAPIAEQQAYETSSYLDASDDAGWSWRVKDVAGVRNVNSDNVMWRDPIAGLACLESLATQSGGQGATPVLITDAPWVARCAASNGIATTGGKSIHAASEQTARSAKAERDKMLLEWKLMWEATRAGTIVANGYPGGLLMTARYSSSPEMGDGRMPSASISFPAGGCNRTEGRPSGTGSRVQMALRLTSECKFERDRELDHNRYAPGFAWSVPLLGF